MLIYPTDFCHKGILHMQLFCSSRYAHGWHGGRHDSLLPGRVWCVHVSLEPLRTNVVVPWAPHVVDVVLHVELKVG